jgi:hypothetical protein
MAAALQLAPAPVHDDRCYRCDCCRAALGVSFTDHYWVCSLCRAAILDALTEEQTRPLFLSYSQALAGFLLRRDTGECGGAAARVGIASSGGASQEDRA